MYHGLPLHLHHLSHYSIQTGHVACVYMGMFVEESPFIVVAVKDLLRYSLQERQPTKHNQEESALRGPVERGTGLDLT